MAERTVRPPGFVAITKYVLLAAQSSGTSSEPAGGSPVRKTCVSVPIAMETDSVPITSHFNSTVPGSALAHPVVAVALKPKNTGTSAPLSPAVCGGLVSTGPSPTGSTLVVAGCVGFGATVGGAVGASVGGAVGATVASGADVLAGDATAVLGAADAGCGSGAVSLFSESAISPTFAIVATVERASIVDSGALVQLAAARLTAAISRTIRRIVMTAVGGCAVFSDVAFATEGNASRASVSPSRIHSPETAARVSPGPAAN